MSKRYGRNQRRRHRQELAETKALADGLRFKAQEGAAFARRYKADLDEAMHIIDRVRTLILDSVALPPEEKRTPFDGDHLVYSVRPNIPLTYSLDTPISAVLRETRVNMRRLECEGIPDSIRQQVHFMARLGNNKVAYAISDEAIMNMPEHLLVDLLINEMAREMVRVVRKIRRRDAAESIRAEIEGMRE